MTGRAQLPETRERIARDPVGEAQSEAERLRAMGFSDADAGAIIAAIERTPGASVNFASAFALQLGDAATGNPLVKSLWMLFADLLAAFVPVIPFAFLPLGPARIVSTGVTTVLLLLLGLGRGVIGRRNVGVTMVETLIIAAAAAGAGLLLGQLITGWVVGS